MKLRHKSQTAIYILPNCNSLTQFLRSFYDKIISKQTQNDVIKFDADCHCYER